MRVNEQKLRTVIRGLLLEQAEAEQVADVQAQLSQIVGLTNRYFDAHPDIGVKLGPLNKLPSTSMGGDVGKAASAAQKKGKGEATWSELDASKLMSQHEQVIGAALLLMPEKMAIEFMNRDDLKSGKLSDIILAMGPMKKLTVDVIKKLGEMLELDLPEEEQQVDGVKKSVTIAKSLGQEKETSLFSDLQGMNTEFAEHLRSQMFIFEDIITLQAREVQLILQEVDSLVLAEALSGGSDELKEFIYSNLSARKAAIVVDEMEALGSSSKAQVKESQTAIVEIIMNLAEEGKVNTRPGNA